MATYLEIYDISDDPSLLTRIAVAVAVAADAIRAEADTVPNHVARIAWAKQAVADPLLQARKAMWVALAQNKGATVNQIINASDAALQGIVDGAVNMLT